MGTDPPPSTEETIEFRSNQDDAWYEVELAVEDETLVVSYVNFPDEDNEYFRAGDFHSIREIEALERRFRPSSLQFQDHECPTIRKDTHVCASCSFDNGDLKFFDADVVQVTHKKHTLDEDGEELCHCSFEVLWRHGQYGGRYTSTSIGSLCKILSSDNLDPALTQFVKISRHCLSLTTPSPSSTRVPSHNRTVGSNHGPSPPNHDSSFEKIPISRPCSYRQGVPFCNPSMPLVGPATCNPSSSLREPAIRNPCLFPEIGVQKRVSFAKETEVIRHVELFSETNDVDDPSSRGVALRTFDSSSRGTAVNNANPFPKRVPVSNLSSFEDIADCNTNQSLNEAVVHRTGASGRIVATNTTIPQSEETVLVNKKSMQDEENLASGHECKWKIIWEDWILEQRRKRKYKYAVRTEKGRRDGLCKKNRRGKLEIRLGCSQR